MSKTYSVWTLAVFTVTFIALASVGRASWQIYSAVSDDLHVKAQLSLLSSQPGGVAAILVIVWLWRSMKNVEALGGQQDNLGAGWAIGAWLIPIANLVLPFIVVRQVAKAELRGRWTFAVLAVWWAAFLMTFGLGIWIAVHGAATPTLWSAAVGAGTYVVAGTALSVLILAISRAQQMRLA